MYGQNKTPTREEMLAEALAFQRDVSRAKDRRGHSQTSSHRPAGYGSGDRIAAGTSRGVSAHPVAPLATPEQFFGRQGPSDSQTPTMPAPQKPDSRPVDDSEPMEVDHNPGVPQDNKAGCGLVGSRWATSVSSHPISHFGGRNADRVAPSKQAPPRNEPSPVSGAPVYAAIDAGKAGATMNKGQRFPSSSPNATLDTPEMPKASKGLLGSRWASDASPASPSPSTFKYPDPSTLEPVYRSEDWLSDLSAEYEALSVKAKNASGTQPTRSSPTIQPGGMQTAAETATKPSTSESQRSSQNPTKFSAASQGATAVQPAGRDAAPNQTSNTNAGPSVEPGRSATSAQAFSDQGGIFNDSAFKDWYNSQFLRRKA